MAEPKSSASKKFQGGAFMEQELAYMKKQVGKTKLFTKESLTEIQYKMRNACIKSFNKFYDIDFIWR
jgi:hypothetical protein